jgi:hypothetical protein
MTFIALILSLSVACLGAVGVASPPRLLAIVQKFQSPAGLYVAMAIRLALGISLFLAAPASRAPDVLRVFGVVIMVAGLITPLFGLERFRRLLDWWAAHGSGFVRLWAAIALAFGLFLSFLLVR